MVEDHLLADRRDPAEAGAPPQVGDAVLQRDAVAAVGLDRRVDRMHRRLGGRVLGHVRGLAGELGRRVRIPQRRRLLVHQPRELELDLGLGERVTDRLVGADRRLPDLALVGVGHGLVERAQTAARERSGTGDALGVEPVEHGREPRLLAADQAVGRDLDVIEEQRPLPVGAEVGHRDRILRQPGGIGVDDADRRQPELAALAAQPRDAEDRVRVLDAGDVVLLALEQVAVAVAPQLGADLVRVRAGVGLGDRKSDPRRAGRDPAQPALLLLVGAVAREDGAGDPRGDDEHQERGARPRGLLDDYREPLHPHATTAPFAGDVDPREPGRRDRVPSRRRRLLALPAVARVVRAERLEQLPDRAADLLLLVARDEADRRRRCAHRAPALAPTIPPSRSAMTESASVMMFSTSSWQVGTSWISPCAGPTLQRPASGSPCS